MGPKNNLKRRLSPSSKIADTSKVIKKTRPIKTTTEKEFYEAAARAASRPPTKAELERIERVRKQREAAAEERAARDDSFASSPNSYESEDFFTDAMESTPVTQDESTELEIVPPNQQAAVSTDAPAIPVVPATEDPAQDLKSFLSNRFDTLASKSDIQIVITDIEGIRHDVSDIQERVSTNAEDIQKLKTVVDRISRGDVEESSSPDSGCSNMTRQARVGSRLGMGRPITYRLGASCAEQEAARSRKYEESLRSIRIWPIAGDDQKTMRDSLEDFLKNCLLHSEVEIGFLGIESHEDQKPARTTDLQRSQGIDVETLGKGAFVFEREDAGLLRRQRE